MTERIKFTVFRDTWLRGGDSCLLDGAGNRCCLGHLARDMGIDDDSLEDEAMPHNVPSPLWPALLGNGKDSLAWDAAITNDDTEITNEQREERLVARFAREGIDVEFKDSEGA